MGGRIGLASIVLVVLGVGVAHAEPLRIRAAWVAPISDWFSIWLDKKDLAVHYGKSYVLESAHYNGTPPMITAMANGELEIAMLAFSTFPIAVVNAGMDDLRVIADEFQDGVEGYYSDEFMVLKDGPIKKVEDLKGKIVATNAAGSGVDVAMKAMLHKHGLEQNRDYTEIEAPFPTMLPMLAEKKADLISAVLPFSLDPELKKIAAPLFTSRDAIGVTQFIMFTARKPFIDKNRAALVDCLEELAAYPALVHGPQESRRAATDRRPPRQGAARTLRLGLHQGRRISRSQHAAEPRRAAEERRPHP